MPPSEQGGGVDAKKRKRGIFTIDGASVVFSFHKSVTEGTREVLSTKIEENGGEVSDEAEGADVLLYDPKRTNEGLLKTAYGAHSNQRIRDLWLKPVAHIKQSIKRKSFELLPPRRQAMPGSLRRPRVEFSQDDKERLAQYLACLVPVPEDGGLQGKVIYNLLVNLHQVDPEEYAWVKRHTAQSWREHYKHNQAYFKELIAKYVDEHGPNHVRHRYFRTRELNRGIKRPHSDGEEDEEEDWEHISTKEQRAAREESPQKRKGKRAAREEEERRQRSIARRQEEEEDSEAEPRARPRNATAGPSGANRLSSEGMTTLIASTQIKQSQTPPGSPIQMHLSPEPQRERSLSLQPQPIVKEIIEIESESEASPKPKRKPKANGKRRVMTPVQVVVEIEKTKKRRVETPVEQEPVVVELEKTKTPTPGGEEDPIVVDSALEEQSAPQPEPAPVKGKAHSTPTPTRSRHTPDVDSAPEEQSAPQPERAPVKGKARSTRTPTPRSTRTPDVDSAPKPEPTPVKGKARSTRTPASRTTRTPDVEPMAPYRNTRSRSRSVEPVALPPTKRRRVNKKPDLPVVKEQDDDEIREPLVQPEPKKRRGKKKQVVEEPQEDVEMRDEGVEPEGHHADQVMEEPEDGHDQDDEERIGDLLRSVDPNNIISEGPRPRKSSPSFTDYQPDYLGPQMYDTMDEDDHQTRMALFSEEDDDDEEQSQGPLFTQKEETQVPQEEDIQMEVEEKEKEQEKPVSTQALSHALTRFHSRRTKKAVSEPVTPRRQVRVRRDSTESEEEFPLEGTGAGKKLREMQNIGRVTPYVPPSGSRAAKHLLQRSPRAFGS